MFSNRPDGLPGSTKPVVARPMAPDERALRSIVPALVLLATAFAFRGVLQNGLVNWDDEQNLVANTAYQTLTWGSLRWMFTTTHGGHYQPLSWLSFAIDHELWGVSAFGFHLTNLLLHLFAVGGFYLVAVELLKVALGRRDPRTIVLGAGAAAIVFAVHPLRVESVAWATERRDVLSGALLMPAVYLYLRAVRVGIGGKRKRYVAASLVLYVLSLAAKASAMTLPIVLLLLDGYPLRRLNRDSLAETGTHSAGRAIAMEKLLYAIPASLIALIALSAQRSSGALWHLTEHPLLLRVAQACYGLMFYLAKTVWPVGLIPLYEQPPDDYATRPIYLACAAAAVAITALVWVLRRRWPSLAVCWAAYVVFLLPVLGLAQSGPQLVADRYTYFACLPWAVLLGGIVARMWGATANRRARARGLVAIAVLGAAAALTYMTSAQVRVWRDSYTLWTEVVSRAPQSGLGHANLAAVLNGRQEFEQARTHAQTALDILPGNRTAHLQLAYAGAALDDLDAAERHYRVGLDIAEHLGQPDTATMTSLAHVLVRMEQWREAEELLRALVEAQPGVAQWHYNLGTFLARRNRFAEAAELFDNVIELAPEWSDAYYRLAIVQDRLGRSSDAFAALERGLAVSPDDVDLLAELAWLLATASEPALRDAARALSVAQRAVTYSNGLSLRAREALAAAQSANGDPAAAVDTIRKLLADDRLAIPAETRTRITDRMRGLETAHLAPPEQ